MIASGAQENNDGPLAGIPVPGMAASPAVGNTSIGILIGDFNGDGRLDLAVANTNDSAVTIFTSQP